MIISPPFLPEQGSAGHADDNAYVDSAMLDSLQLSTAAGGAPGGSYPLGGALTWHNGVHLRAPSDAQGRGRLPVRAIADGTVIFKRSPKSTNQDATDPQNYNPFGTEPAWTDNGIVIIRHTTDIGATGDTPTSVTYYSVYMHLSSIDATVVESKPIWRKDKIGQAGQIFGEAHQIHFEICMDAANLQALVGSTRPITLTEPNAPPTADGRTDAVFGSVYIHLPAGTPTSETEPTHHLGRPTAGASAATDHFVTNTLRVAQWVEIRYQNGQGTVSSFRATDRKDAFKVGDPIGQPHVEPDFEYDMYTEANKRHNSLPSTVQSNSSPSGWYELLRFGRNIGPDRLPADAAHWRQIPTDTGTVWADLNADGTHVFSDADFPAFKGWQCFDDDATQEDQRCDSIELKRLVRDPQVPESIRERKALARRLGRPDVRERLKRAICRFPTEWDKATIAQRYDWLKVDEEFKIDEGEAWDKFTAHCEAISFDDLPQEYKEAVWHFHPRMFIAHMRQCWWMSGPELIQCIPRNSPAGRIEFKDALNRLAKWKLALNILNRKFGINSSGRITHLLAQVWTETGYLRLIRESGANTATYAPYVGRGLIQITWKDKYESYDRFSKLTPHGNASFNLELIANDQYHAANSSGFYWASKDYKEQPNLRYRNLSRIADEGLTPDSIGKLCLWINGGGNHYDHRHIHTYYIKRILDDEIYTATPKIEKLQLSRIEFVRATSIVGGKPVRQIIGTQKSTNALTIDVDHTPQRQ